MPEFIEIVIYDWDGQMFGLRMERLCVECALAVTQAQAVADEHPDWPIRVTRKHWLDHFWAALRHGGFFPPIIVVDDRRLRQGSVPTRAELTAAAERALERRGWGKPRVAQPPEADSILPGRSSNRHQLRISRERSLGAGCRDD